jgi:aarF domain-containing kinase
VVLTHLAEEERMIVELPRVYDWDALHTYWSHRPMTTASRLMEIASHLFPLAIRAWSIRSSSSLKEHHQQQLHELAVQLRQALETLGPAFQKAGQQLSIRPDLIPPIILYELQKLCDSVRPVPDDIMLIEMAQQLIGNPDPERLKDIFVEIPQRVASASLGQVYKAQLRPQAVEDEEDDHNPKYVAIKVQRPGMLEKFSLDLYILQRIGVLVDTWTSIWTQQPPFHRALYEYFAQGSYSELDYLNEAANQEEFRMEFAKRSHLPIHVPQVYSQYTTRTVLTTEWIDGIKLADASPQQIQTLIPVGIEIFLTQLLEIGRFHSDPHVGNLLVDSKTGQLVLLDYGLCATVQDHERRALSNAVLHLTTRDYQTLIHHDAKELGFLPADLDVTELEPIITKILTVGLQPEDESSAKNRNNFQNDPNQVSSSSSSSPNLLARRKRKLMEISNELNDIFFRYPFAVPPFFALVTRGLGLLEGIALTGDPNFDIFQATAPFARRRILMQALNGSSHRSTAVDGSDSRSHTGGIGILWYSFWRGLRHRHSSVRGR